MQPTDDLQCTTGVLSPNACNLHIAANLTSTGPSIWTRTVSSDFLKSILELRNTNGEPIGFVTIVVKHVSSVRLPKAVHLNI